VIGRPSPHPPARSSPSPVACSPSAVHRIAWTRRYSPRVKLSTASGRRPSAGPCDTVRQDDFRASRSVPPGPARPAAHVHPCRAVGFDGLICTFVAQRPNPTSHLWTKPPPICGPVLGAPYSSAGQATFRNHLLSVRFKPPARPSGPLTGQPQEGLSYPESATGARPWQQAPRRAWASTRTVRHGSASQLPRSSDAD